MAKQISELNWKKRLLLISYQNDGDQIFIRTTKFISNEFGIWLIGYDGSIKDYSKDDKIFLRLFNLIDSMPMRQNEIKKDKC